MVESTEVVAPASITMQPPLALSDYLSSMQAKTYPKMSAIELADIQIPGKGAPFPYHRTISFHAIDRERDSGYHIVDGFQEFGPVGGIHHQRYVPNPLAVIRQLPHSVSQFCPRYVRV